MAQVRTPATSVELDWIPHSQRWYSPILPVTIIWGMNHSNFLIFFLFPSFFPLHFLSLKIYFERHSYRDREEYTKWRDLFTDSLPEAATSSTVPGWSKEFLLDSPGGYWASKHLGHLLSFQLIKELGWECRSQNADQHSFEMLPLHMRFAFCVITPAQSDFFPSLLFFVFPSSPFSPYLSNDF